MRWPVKWNCPGCLRPHLASSGEAVNQANLEVLWRAGAGRAESAGSRLRGTVLEGRGDRLLLGGAAA